MLGCFYLVKFVYIIDNRNIQENKEKNFHIICTRS